MIPDRYRIGSPNGFLISSPLRRSVDCSILLADVEVLLAVVAVVADVHRQPTGLTPARSALTASGHHFEPPRRTVMGSGDGGSDHRSLRHRIDVSEGRACESPLVRLDVRAVHPRDVPAGLPVGGSSEWTFAGLPAARHQRLPRPGLRDPDRAAVVGPTHPGTHPRRRLLLAIAAGRGDPGRGPHPLRVQPVLDRFISGFTMGAVKG